MKFSFPALGIVAAAVLALSACSPEETGLVCTGGITEVTAVPSLPATTGNRWAAKDNLEVTLDVACESTVCMTMDGSTPAPGRANTSCFPAPIKKIPITRSLCLKYFVIAPDGSQGGVKTTCYEVEEAPQVSCSPDSTTTNQQLAVTLSSDKPDTTILYTTDGLDPDPNDGGTYQEEAPVTVTVGRTTTLKFRGRDAVGNLGRTRTCTYNIDMDPPITTASPLPASGQNAPMTVNLSTNEPATIYYTTDGSTPEPGAIEPNGTTKTSFMSAQVELTQSSYLRFFAIDIAGNEEEVQEEIYFFGNQPALGIDPAPGFHSETSIEVTLRGSAPDGSTVDIWYTTNNENPSPGDGNLYSAPIDEFSEAGEYTLKYMGDAGSGQTGVRTAVYTLGVLAPPFYRELNFTQPSHWDEDSSTLSMELNTHRGYAGLRRLPPEYKGGRSLEQGDDPASVPPGTPNPGVSVGLIVDTITTRMNLYYGSPYELRLYDVDDASNPNQRASRCFPQTLPNPFNIQGPCGQGTITGQPMGVYPYTEAGYNYVLTPWTNGGNQGGYASQFYRTGTTMATAYNRAPRSQFQGENPIVDDFDTSFVRMPKNDMHVRGGRAFIPRANNGHHVYAYAVTDGQDPYTTSDALYARATAMASTTSNRLAVGDASGRIYILDRTNLNRLDTASVGCASNVDCRINGLAWMVDGDDDYLLAALGYYGDAVTGQIAVAQVATNGTMTLLSSAALPATDDYVITSSVEQIAIAGVPVGTTRIAVAAIRNQGVLLLDTSDIANGKVHSLGYTTGRDFDDDYFYPVDIDVFRDTAYAASFPQRFVVADGGYFEDGNALRSHGGFRLFDVPANPQRWETDGVLYTNNINTSERQINRIRLVTAQPDPLAGMTIEIIADGTTIAQPINIGTDVAFESPVSDIRAKITFEGSDTTPLRLEYLQFQLSPIE